MLVAQLVRLREMLPHVSHPSGEALDRARKRGVLEIAENLLPVVDRINAIQRHVEKWL